jgi:electron transfer flavoprotein beta subunit
MGDCRMKVLVPVKRVIDYNVKVRVKADGRVSILRT